MFADLESNIALDFLKAYPTPRRFLSLTVSSGIAFPPVEHHLGEARCQELWEKLSHLNWQSLNTWSEPSARLMDVLLVQLERWSKRSTPTPRRFKVFSPHMPAAEFIKELPGGKSGTTVPLLWAELGDAKSRWQSFRHLQAEAGGVPVTKASGKSRIVEFRFACNKLLRYASYWFSFNSLNRCEWANKYYRDQRR